MLGGVGFNFGLGGHGGSDDGRQLDVDLVYGFGVGDLVLNLNLDFCCSTSNWWCVEVDA